MFGMISLYFIYHHLFVEVFDWLVFYSSIIVPLQDILAYLDKRKVQGAGLYHCIG